MAELARASLAHDAVIDLTALPRHDLSADEYASVEGDLVADIEAQFPLPGVYTARIDARSRYADLIRTLEHVGDFEEVSDLMAPYEPNFVFIAIVDTRL
jgi:hypothetical protein